MLLKKKINIILIVLMLGLWGTVAYKTINRYFFSKQQLTVRKATVTDMLELGEIHRDTFALEKISRDPFLDKKAEVPAALISFSVKKNTAVIPKEKADWPMITYHGYIASKERNEELILLKIDLKLYKVKLNVPIKIKGIIVKKRTKNAVEVLLGSETKIIRIK